MRRCRAILACSKPTLAAKMSNPCLSVTNLQAFYGDGQVLHGIDFDVGRGEVVTLLGRNGAGKSTTLRSIMGLLRRRSGSIMFEGKQLIDQPANRIAKAGIGFCPEDRGIFSSLSVEENLLLPPIVRADGMSTDEIYHLFPNLRERRLSRGASLSGGEQQMLAIARILRTGSTLLLLDEPTEGLAPVIVKAIGEVIKTIKRRGHSVLLVEQNYRFAARIADRHNVIVDGKIVARFSALSNQDSLDRIKGYLSV
jgi:branched-chain amino acid transport system ATP-binding protein